MKLRNKKTGEIKDWCFSEALSLWTAERLGPDGCSLENFIANVERFRNEWEVAPEEKEWPQEEDLYWLIATSGEATSDVWEGDKTDLGRAGVSNVFRTKEEAEKAVEKLKALKRLKDEGFTISQWRHTPDMNSTTGSVINIKGFIPAVMKNMKDLDLLFGGKHD